MTTRPSHALVQFLWVDLGWTRADLAYLFGCHSTTVRGWLRAAGIAPQPRPQRIVPAAAPLLPGRMFFIELAEQTEMGWSAQQARERFAAAVQNRAGNRR